MSTVAIWHSVLACVGAGACLCAGGQQSLADAHRAHSMIVRTATGSLEEAFSPASSVEDALHAFFTQADVVFAGTVTSVTQNDGSVTVRFRVEDAVRGLPAGRPFLLREWSGLWRDDPSRYVVGERRLMLLHAASVAGFSSPVGGGRGAIRLHGSAVLPSADLRWVATEVRAAGPSTHTMDVSFTAARDSESEYSAVDGMMILDMLHAWQRAEELR